MLIERWLFASLLFIPPKPTHGARMKSTHSVDSDPLSARPLDPFAAPQDPVFMPPELTQVPLYSLMPLLSRDPVRYVFPLFVCGAVPDGMASVVVSGDSLVGCIVSGNPFGVFTARSGWLVASSPTVADVLLEAADSALWRVGIQCERSLAARWAERVPGLSVSHDLFLAISPQAAAAIPELDKTHVVQLDRRNLGTVTLAEDIRQMLGSPLDYPDGFPLFGLMCEGQIVAVAETFVRHSQVLSIQQVYTAPAHRGRGAARTLIGHIARAAGQNGYTSTYLVEETNHASVRLALSLGFEVVWELACICQDG